MPEMTPADVPQRLVDACDAAISAAYEASPDGGLDYHHGVRIMLAAALPLYAQQPPAPRYEPAEYTDRGFAMYGGLTDDRGHTIRVQESSAADGPHVWIFTSLGTDQASDPHLTIGQARLLRDMLDAFIEHRSPGESEDEDA